MPMTQCPGRGEAASIHLDTTKVPLESAPCLWVDSPGAPGSPTTRPNDWTVTADLAVSLQPGLGAAPISLYANEAAYVRSFFLLPI